MNQYKMSLSTINNKVKELANDNSSWESFYKTGKEIGMGTFRHSWRDADTLAMVWYYILKTFNSIINHGA